MSTIYPTIRPKNIFIYLSLSSSKWGMYLRCKWVNVIILIAICYSICDLWKHCLFSYLGISNMAK